MLFYTYALYSHSADIIYVGQTDCLDDRISEHNGLGKYTTWASRHKPWVLLHFETFQTRKEAMGREKQLKTGRGREFLRSLLKEKGWSPPDGG